MRRMVLSLVSAAALTLAGCNAPSPTAGADGDAPAAANSTAGGTNGRNGAANAAIPGKVTGTVALRGQAQLSSNARLDIRLVDISAGAATAGQALASKTVMPANQFPQDFELTFDPTQVQAKDLYVVQATLVDGERHYAMPIQAPVLTNGRPTTVAIELVAEQTPGEKTLAAFTDVQKQIGGMKITRGTKLEKDDSRGWQLFRQAGEVKFIRELVDYTDKGFTSTDFAYRDGKPWVVVQETKASADAKPSATDKAGWDETGTLVLSQHQAAGTTQPLDADVAAKLKRQATDILSIATNGKNK
ncbi:MAG: YbaY family lipoprotein [Rhodanobacter sp.]